MAKVKKSTVWKNVLVGAALLFALAALSMIFFEVIKGTSTGLNAGETFKGYETAFFCIKWVGLQGANYNLVEVAWQFSFSNFMGYFLLLCGIICCVGAIAYKKQGLVLAVLTMICFGLAGASFINQVGNLQPYTQGLREYLEVNNPLMTANEINEQVNEYILAARAQFELSWGAIVGAICAFVAAALALASKIAWQICYKNEE